mmetsp:Transcript_19528/g.21962  ORF Transcript_19528/g.21962 Transcript_19528/m.21962 type:complete len:92 (-) Transcript_19528:269-544(-)
MSCCHRDLSIVICSICRLCLAVTSMSLCEDSFNAVESGPSGTFDFECFFFRFDWFSQIAQRYSLRNAILLKYSMSARMANSLASLSSQDGQ